MNFEIDRRAKIAEAEALLVKKLMEAMQPAAALVLWLDRPAIFLAAVTSWVWEVLKELEPMALEQVLRTLEQGLPYDTPGMLSNRQAIAAWIRSERELALRTERTERTERTTEESVPSVKSVKSVDHGLGVGA